jgi:RNA polymerase sigma-70 factor (ECF subfamily)
VATRVTDLRTEGDYRVLDDRLLVLDFQAGQPQAFVEIHRRYGPLARHVCSRFLPNRHDADEAFQETMIRVFQGLHRFNGQYALQPWIARIATNVSLDQIRTRARRPQLEDGSIEDHERRDPADGPEEMFERLIERDLVLSVLSDLPDSHRTALVLRELEGRSHKEIALALDITPAQAKALIHRAKGSFRRNWLLAVTEKGGLAGIALLPLIWMLRVADGARRIVEKVGGQASQVAQAATPEMVTSAANSPATVSAAASMTERVVAAGMTILVAGGVTMGAATIVKNGGDRDQSNRAAPVVASPAAPQTDAPEVLAPVVAPSPEEQPRVKPSKEPPPEEPVEEVVPPIDEAAESPAPTPSPTTEPSPTDTPSQSPSPTGPPPAPDWSGSFLYLGPPTQPCECDGPTTLSESRLEGAAGQEISFHQVINGVVHDNAGSALWGYYLELDGAAGRSDGNLALKFVLGTAEGGRYYDGDGFLASATRNDNGSVTYQFVGAYAMRSDQAPVLGAPLQGRIVATISVWRDGTIYVGSFTMLEASA